MKSYLVYNVKSIAVFVPLLHKGARTVLGQSEWKHSIKPRDANEAINVSNSV